MKDVEIAVGTLKEPIYFIKESKEKQLTLSVIVIRLENNSRIDTRAFIDSRCTGFCINQ